jgi:GNAT superfamily N-acetyltransferase
MRRASLADIPLLLELMSGFYSEGGYKLDHTHAEIAFIALLSDERLGYAWLIEEEPGERKIVGYLVLTLRFGMEYGGLMACLDDLFVIPQSRNKGLSTAALSQVRDFCEQIGIRAITVEVGYGNAPAQAVYRRLGLTEAKDRQLLALALRAPTHRS